MASDIFYLSMKQKCAWSTYYMGQFTFVESTPTWDWTPIHQTVASHCSN